jgi:hypothetical protein
VVRGEENFPRHVVRAKKKKKTPRTHSAGVKQLISPQADADWIAERERETLEIEAA